LIAGHPLTDLVSSSEYHRDKSANVNIADPDAAASVRTVSYNSRLLLLRFLPLRRLSNCGERLTPKDSTLSVTLRPQGLVPSRRFHSPHSLPNLFHFDSAYGVLPSRSCSFRDAVHSLECRTPLTVSADRAPLPAYTPNPPSQGFAHSRKFRPEACGLDRRSYGYLHGIHPR